MANLEQTLRLAIEKFNAKVKEDAHLQRELEGIVRSVQIEIIDGKSYHFLLENKEIKKFSEGTIENANIRIIIDTATMIGIINKEISPIKAYATRKLRIKASILDLMKLQKFLK